MSMSMNSGYVGWSMSIRAAEAYESGEKPKSKWTKKAMLAAICDACPGQGLVYEPEKVSGMLKADLFDRFFEFSSWHHTSKYCNETDFYAVAPEALRGTFRPETGEEREARLAVERAKELDAAKTDLKTQTADARRTYESSDGKVQDESVRTELKRLLDEADSLSSTMPKDYADMETAVMKAEKDVKVEVWRLEYEARRRERAERMERWSRYEAEHGFAPNTLAAYALAHPEKIVDRRISHRGNPTVSFEYIGQVYDYHEADMTTRPMPFSECTNGVIEHSGLAFDASVPEERAY